MSQKTITVGTAETPANIDTNFSNAQDNFTDLYSVKANKTTTQATEGTPIVIVEAQPKTAGSDKWAIHQNSWANTDGGAGTYNHGAFLGWNAGRHSAAAAVDGQPSLIMGMEDNYYNPVDSTFGMEWYVEYWSPDGTSAQMFRPFYTRLMESDGNAAPYSHTAFDIGGSAGFFSVRSAGGSQLLTIEGTVIETYKPLMPATATGTTATPVEVQFCGLGNSVDTVGVYFNNTWSDNYGAGITFKTRSTANVAKTALTLDQSGAAIFGGEVQIPKTLTPAGTTGNQTINTPAGSVNIATGSPNVTVTNSLVTTSSIVFAVADDTLALVKNVQTYNGSFIIRLTSDAANEVRVKFLVIN